MGQTVRQAALIFVLAILALALPVQAGDGTAHRDSPARAEEAAGGDPAAGLPAAGLPTLDPECLGQAAQSSVQAPWDELGQATETLMTEGLESGWDCQVNQCRCRLDDCEGGACLCAFTTGCTLLEIEFCCKCACLPCS